MRLLRIKPPRRACQPDRGRPQRGPKGTHRKFSGYAILDREGFLFFVTFAPFCGEFWFLYSAPPRRAGQPDRGWPHGGPKGIQRKLAGDAMVDREGFLFFVTFAPFCGEFWFLYSATRLARVLRWMPRTAAVLEMCCL